MAFIEGEKIRLGDSSPKPSSLVYLSVVGSQSQQSPRKPFKIQHMSTFFFSFLRCLDVRLRLEVLLQKVISGTFKKNVLYLNCCK